MISINHLASPESLACCWNITRGSRSENGGVDPLDNANQRATSHFFLFFQPLKWGACSYSLTGLSKPEMRGRVSLKEGCLCRQAPPTLYCVTLLATGCLEGKLLCELKFSEKKTPKQKTKKPKPMAMILQD